MPETVDSLDRLVEKHGRRGVLIDTNLLLVLLIGRQRPEAVERFARTKGHYRAEDFAFLDQFVRRFSRIITAPHILTEVSNLLPNGNLREFRDRLRQEAELYEELQCEARRTVLDTAFHRFGLTDTVIALLACGQLLVLTDDFPLYGLLAKRGVDVINFNHVRPLAWRS